MATRTRFGEQDGPAVERPSYKLNGWLDLVIQHRVTQHREFLASRNAGHSDGVRAQLGRAGGGQLHDPMLDIYDFGEE